MARKLKFKTLDNKLTEVEVDKDISVPELKMIVKEKMGVEPQLQRMIFKGKQLKDDKLLSDYVTEDGEIVHLMVRMPEQQPNNTNTPTGNTQQGSNTSNNTQQNTQQSNPLGNILGNLLSDPNAMVQMTSMILGGPNSGGNNSTGPNLNNILQGLLNPSNQRANINTTTTTNTNQPGNTFTSTSTTPNQPQQNTNITTQEQPRSSYPMLTAPNQHISNLQRINAEISGASNLPSLPGLNYPLNVLTAVGNSLNAYSRNMTSFLSSVNLLSELLQRESLLADPAEREKVRQLIQQVRAGLEEAGQSSTLLGGILSGLDYGTAPGTGFYRMGEILIEQVQVDDSAGDVNMANNTGTVNSNNQGDANVASSSNPLSNLSALLNPQGSGNSSDPFGQILSQMSQPENMQMMMNMVGNMFGGSNTPGNINNTSNTANPFGNLLSQLMNSNSINNNNNNDEPAAQNSLDYFNNLLANNNLRKTKLSEIPEQHLRLRAEPDFAPLLKIIYDSLTVQEVIDLSNLILSPLSKIRGLIKESLISSKTSAESITQLLLERMTLHENETDKLINQSFSIEEYLAPFIKALVAIFSDDQSSALKFEADLKKEIASFFSKFYSDLKAAYNTKEEGAFFFLDCNFEDLLIALIGKEAVAFLFQLNEMFISNISDNLVNLAKNYKVEEKEEDVKMQVEEIFEVANLDKSRLELPQGNFAFSEHYTNTSLFK